MSTYLIFLALTSFSKSTRLWKRLSNTSASWTHKHLLRCCSSFRQGNNRWDSANQTWFVSSYTGRLLKFLLYEKSTYCWNDLMNVATLCGFMLSFSSSTKVFTKSMLTVPDFCQKANRELQIFWNVNCVFDNNAKQNKKQTFAPYIFVIQLTRKTQAQPLGVHWTQVLCNLLEGTHMWETKGLFLVNNSSRPTP